MTVTPTMLTTSKSLRGKIGPKRQRANRHCRLASSFIYRCRRRCRRERGFRHGGDLLGTFVVREGEEATKLRLYPLTSCFLF